MPLTERAPADHHAPVPGGPYTSATLLYMSGTGNTLRVGRWMAQAARARGLPTTLSALERRPPADFSCDPTGLLGVLMPTHGFTAPWHVIRSVVHLPRGRGRPAFVVATRAGSQFGKVALPGLEGTAIYLIALLLALWGYRVRGCMPVDMPSNWVAAHPSFGPAAVAEIIARAQPRAERFITRLLDGQRAFCGFVTLIFGLLLTPVSAGYLVFGRFMLAKAFFADARCNGCGLCAAQCPQHAIRMWGRRHPRPYWTYSCESCMRCMAYCPLGAIQAGHSWVVLANYVSHIPLAAHLLIWLLPLSPLAENLRSGGVQWVIQYAYFLLSLYTAYAVFLLLMRIPAVNALFTYTTFTRFWRRYHEPETRPGDFVGPPS